MKIGTRLIHSERRNLSAGDPLREPVTFAATYHAPGNPENSPYTYGRYHNPTWTAFEQTVGAIEGGTTVVFASGMAAVTALLSTSLQRGDVVALPAESYYTTRLLAERFFAENGVEVRKSPTRDNAQQRDVPAAKLLWVETPTNPGLEVCDIAALAEVARTNGTLLAVDNTTATIVGQDPISLGADFCVSSDTKALTGHGDIVLGHVTARDPEWAEKLRRWRSLTGAVAGPMEVWLATRSLATLEVRLERACRNAALLAEYLTGRSDVEYVRYPGLPQDPSHRVASRQMRNFGPVIGFVLPSETIATNFLQRCRIITEATSFGGVHSTAERRARWGGDAIPEGFIRLSVGCEDPDDLLHDIAQSLDASANRQ